MGVASTKEGKKLFQEGSALDGANLWRWVSRERARLDSVFRQLETSPSPPTADSRCYDDFFHRCFFAMAANESSPTTLDGAGLDVLLTLAYEYAGDSVDRLPDSMDKLRSTLMERSRARRSSAGESVVGVRVTFADVSPLFGSTPADCPPHSPPPPPPPTDDAARSRPKPSPPPPPPLVATPKPKPPPPPPPAPQAAGEAALSLPKQDRPIRGVAVVGSMFTADGTSVLYDAHVEWTSGETWSCPRTFGKFNGLWEQLQQAKLAATAAVEFPPQQRKAKDGLTAQVIASRTEGLDRFVRAMCADSAAGTHPHFIKFWRYGGHTTVRVVPRDPPPPPPPPPQPDTAATLRQKLHPPPPAAASPPPPPVDAATAPPPSPATAPPPPPATAPPPSPATAPPPPPPVDAATEPPPPPPASQKSAPPPPPPQPDEEALRSKPPPPQPAPPPTDDTASSRPEPTPAPPPPPPTGDAATPPPPLPPPPQPDDAASSASLLSGGQEASEAGVPDRDIVYRLHCPDPARRRFVGALANAVPQCELQLAPADSTFVSPSGDLLAQLLKEFPKGVNRTLLFTLCEATQDHEQIKSMYRRETGRRAAHR